VTFMRTVETRVSHTGDATLVSDVRSFRLGVPGSCAKVRAGIAHAGALTVAGCAQGIAWVGRQVCCRMLSRQDTPVQRPRVGDVHTRCDVLVAKCRLLANCSHGVVQVRDTH
jgi:hypothetical protein